MDSKVHKRKKYVLNISPIIFPIKKGITFLLKLFSTSVCFLYDLDIISRGPCGVDHELVMSLSNDSAVWRDTSGKTFLEELKTI